MCSEKLLYLALSSIYWEGLDSEFERKGVLAPYDLELKVKDYYVSLTDPI